MGLKVPSFFCPTSILFIALKHTNRYLKSLLPSLTSRPSSPTPAFLVSSPFQCLCFMKVVHDTLRAFIQNPFSMPVLSSLVLSFKVGVPPGGLVSCGFCNKFSQIWKIKKKRNLLSQSFGGQKSKVLAGPLSLWRICRRICSLPPPAAGGKQLSLACGGISPSALPFHSLLCVSDSKLSRPLSYKERRDCRRTTQMTQYTLLLSSS